jgi:hypothetical protein
MRQIFLSPLEGGALLLGENVRLPEICKLYLATSQAT